MAKPVAPPRVPNKPPHYPQEGNQTALSQLKLAEETEVRLSRLLKSRTSANSDAEAQAQALRLRLCELYADVLIDSPRVGHAHDVPNRMWRSCFYRRIGEFRSRGAAAAKTGSGTEGVRTAHRTFLREGIQFYDYVIKQYREKLDAHEVVVAGAEAQRRRALGKQRRGSKSKKGSEKSPMSQTRGTQSFMAQGLLGSQDESEDGSSREIETDSAEGHDAYPMPPLPEGVILSLHRFLICIGDLHRYLAQVVDSGNGGSSKQSTPSSPDFSDAEKHYLAAVKLVPGNGNPYNQLAVLAQHKHQDAVAMYWYARALIAKEPFDITAAPNLSRLLRTVVRSFSGGNLEDIASSVIERAANRRIPNRPAVTKRALSEFVFLQGKLYFGTTSTCDAVVKFQSYLHGWTDRLREILSENILGDAILTRLVGVAIYSVVTAGAHAPKTVKKEVNLRVRAKRSGDCFLALAVLFRMTSVLCEQANRAFRTNRGNGRHLKFVAPLVICADFFLAHSSTIFEVAAEDEALDPEVGLCAKEEAEARALFLERFCDLLNNLNSRLDSKKVAKVARAEKRVLKERSSFMGYLALGKYAKAGRKSYISRTPQDIPEDAAFDSRTYRLEEFAQKMLHLRGEESSLLYSTEEGYYARPTTCDISNDIHMESEYPYGVDLAAAQERHPDGRSGETQAPSAVAFHVDEDEDDEEDIVYCAGDSLRAPAMAVHDPAQDTFLSLADLHTAPTLLPEVSKVVNRAAMMPPPGLMPPPGFDRLADQPKLHPAAVPLPPTNPLLPTDQLLPISSNAPNMLSFLGNTVPAIHGHDLNTTSYTPRMSEELIPTANPFAEENCFRGFNWSSTLGDLSQNMYDMPPGKGQVKGSEDAAAIDALFGNNDLGMNLNTHNPFFFSVP